MLIMKSAHSQSGVMLLEVLIGMLLFIIGIMGIMGLQAVSMKHSIDAKYRTEASALANQIVGRMWTDNSNLGSYAIAAGAECPDPPANDKDRWICAVKNTLPNATGATSPTIVVNGTVVTITINWRKDSSDPIHNHVLVTDISPN